MAYHLPTIDELQHFRSITDPIADEVVAAVEQLDGYEIEGLLNHLTRNRDLDHTQLPEVVSNYFKTQDRLPAWTDQNKLVVGAEVFQRYGIEASMLLFFLALPSAYACWRGAKVLHETGRLSSTDEARYTRRLMETTQYTIDVMAPGAFSPNGAGIVAALKVRLIHASIRYFIRKRNDLPVKIYDEPINQEDLAGTLMSFSAMVISGMEKMGVSLSQEEEEGYYHCWRVAGHLVGVAPELVPETYSDGLKLGFLIINHQKGASPHGNELTNALVEFVNKKIPGKRFDNHLPIFMIRHFMDEDLHSVFSFNDYKPNLLDKLVDFLLHEFSSLMKFFRIDKETVMLGKRRVMKDHFQQMLVTHFNNHKNIYLTIPPSLQENWALDQRGRVVGVTKD